MFTTDQAHQDKSKITLKRTIINEILPFPRKSKETFRCYTFLHPKAPTPHQKFNFLIILEKKRETNIKTAFSTKSKKQNKIKKNI